MRARPAELTTTWWLSFCDPRRPSDSRFLGIVLVDAHSLGEALDATYRAGCNPGGEVAALDITPEMKRTGPAAYVEGLARLPRLTVLSREDIESGPARSRESLDGTRH
jgi:hypothetical protein